MASNKVKITAIVYDSIFSSSDKKAKEKTHNIFTVIVLKIGDVSFPKIFKTCDVLCVLCYVMEMWLEMLPLVMYHYIFTFKIWIKLS